MHIDWFTVVAEAINFIILVVLLTRLVYKPVLKTVADREARIANELADATKKEEHAAQEIAEYQKKQQELHNQQQDIINKAKAEAEETKKQLLEQARQESQTLTAQYHDALQRDIAKMEKRITQNIQTTVLDISRKVLTDLSDSTLEDSIICAFTDKLKTAQKKTHPLFVANVTSLTLRSGFELTAPNKKTLTQAIHTAINSNVEIEYETDASLIGGIELCTAEHKLSWTIDSYLQSMHANMQELLLKASANDANSHA